MKTIYDPGWKTVWRIYSCDNLFKSIVIPLCLAIVACIVCSFSELPSIKLLEHVSGIILSIGPSMLGFTLSGYALMMGLSNSQFIQQLIKFKEEGKEHSQFQALNAVFAVVLGGMFVTTLAGAFVGIIVNAQIAMPYCLNIITVYYNWLWLFILYFLVFYIINAIKDIVMNIFSFGQFIQIFVESNTDESLDE